MAHPFWEFMVDHDGGIKPMKKKNIFKLYIEKYAPHGIVTVLISIVILC